MIIIFLIIFALLVQTETMNANPEFSPLSPYHCCLAAKETDEPSFLANNVERGEGEGKHFCDHVGASMQGDQEICVCLKSSVNEPHTHIIQG